MNRAEFCPRFSSECLSRKALYVPAPNPGHAVLKSSFVKGSDKAPDFTASTMEL